MTGDEVMDDRLGENTAIGRQVMTIPEAARALGVSRNFGYELARRGEITVIRLGRRILVPKAPFERMLGLISERGAVNERTH